MDRKLNVLITGASSGIGRALAVRLSRGGHRLALVARRRAELVKTALMFADGASESLVLPMNIDAAASAKKAMDVVRKKWGHLDVLVNNAGWGVYGPFEKTPEKDFRGVMETNFFAVVRFCKAALDAFPKGGGHIINIASVAGLSGYPGETAYSPTKFALIGFSECLHYDLKSRGVKVSVVNPGAVKTSFFDHPSWKKFPSGRHRVELSADAVAALVEDVIRRPRFMATTPLRSRIILKVRAISMPFYLWAIGRAVKA